MGDQPTADTARKPACPSHGATARSDGSCMVRGCDFDRAVDAALSEAPLTALSVEAQARLEQVSRPADSHVATKSSGEVVDLLAALQRSVDAAKADRVSRPGEHVCSECSDCIHDGHKCCGYDGACCKEAPHE